ncbi:MAG: hypothetical protein WCH34_11850 [Bacteroidota bacterium]
MTKASETGHAKNVAHFGDLIIYLITLGTAYAPVKPSLLIAALQTKFTSAKDALSAINALLPDWSNAINAREIVFSPLSKLITRVVAAVEASDVSIQFINDVKFYARKLQGKRATPKKATIADDPSTPEDESQKSISASQMSFDNRIENMDKLIDLLSSQSNYNPNEDDLKVASLTILHTSMKTTNTAVITTSSPLSNARINRDVILYHKVTGLVKISKEVKAYVKSVFGATSPQFKLVSKFKFTTPKQK